MFFKRFHFFLHNFSPFSRRSKAIPTYVKMFQIGFWSFQNVFAWFLIVFSYFGSVFDRFQGVEKRFRPVAIYFKYVFVDFKMFSKVLQSLRIAFMTIPHLQKVSNIGFWCVFKASKTASKTSSFTQCKVPPELPLPKIRVAHGRPNFSFWIVYWTFTDPELVLFGKPLITEKCLKPVPLGVTK